MLQTKFHHLALVMIIAILGGIGGGYLQTQIFSPYRAIQPENLRIENQSAKTDASSILPENAVIDLADQLRSSVVSVIGEKDMQYVLRNPSNFFFSDPFFDEFFGNPRRNREDLKPKVQTEKQQIAAGTGFIISTDGLIMTNKHVVSDTEAEYTVFFADDQQYIAEVISRDPTNDIAILKIKDAGAAKFQPVKFVPNQTNVKIGQFVVAIGNALGQFDNTVTLGVISASGRSITAGDGNGSSENLSQLLQTDAAINPGNSGGPLVNLSGEVVGINTAVAGSAQGIGFALPLDNTRIQKILEQIKKYGKIMKPYLGIRYLILTPEINKELKVGSDTGAWIRGDNDLPAVLPDTPASQADLRGGDIVLSINGKKVDQDNPLSDLINDYAPKDEVNFEILRDGKQQNIKVTLGEWQEEETRR